MSRRRRAEQEPTDPGLLVDVGPPSTPLVPSRPNLAPRRAQPARRRKAASLAGVRHFGRRTPVTLTIEAPRGAEGWLRVRSTTGEFFIPIDAGVWNLVKQVQDGGHWVR